MLSTLNVVFLRVFLSRQQISSPKVTADQTARIHLLTRLYTFICVTTLHNRTNCGAIKIHGGVLSVTVIAEGNEISDLVSNAGRNCLRFLSR